MTASLVDLQACYGALARGEALSSEQLQEVLQELAHFRRAAAWLAEAHATTLATLPASASQSLRRRLVTVCDTAATMLDGEHRPGASDRLTPERARQECLAVVRQHASR